MSDNQRFIFADISAFQEKAFLEILQSNKNLVLKSHRYATPDVLQDRFAFSCDFERISIVYETKSKNLIITAPSHILDLLKQDMNAVILESDKNAESQNKATLERNKFVSEQNKAVSERNKAVSVQKRAISLQNNSNVQAVKSRLDAKQIEDILPKTNKEIPSIHETKNNSSPNQANKPALNKKVDNKTIQQPVINKSVQQKSSNTAKQQSSSSIGNQKIANTKTIQKAPNNSISKQASGNKTQQLTTSNKISEQTGSKITPQHNKLSASTQKANSPVMQQASNKLAQNTKAKEKNLPLTSEKELDELYKTAISIKKFDKKMYESLLQKLHADKSLKIESSQKAESSTIFAISAQNNIVHIRFQPKKNILQLQGKRSPLFVDMQLLTSQICGYKNAVTSHIELSTEQKKAKENAITIQKRLKKLIPTAFDFLSEQSKIDFSIAMLDINNDAVKLSDYSMLLVPAYRGLESLIFDLQRKKNIEVKMIGQAFEKDDGKYVLKSGYRKRIQSIVFAEVMADLYTEYFEKRNFYAHSDFLGDQISRVITDKTKVKEIFDRLIAKIEYDTKKLREIGF